MIELEQVSRIFESDEGLRVEALRDVSLSIGRGEYVCITGPSGSGKTTLMNILGFLDSPSSGTYRLSRKEAQHLDADSRAWLRRRFCGFVFQNYNLIGSLSAFENVELPARYSGLAKTARADRTTQLLGQLGLADRMDFKPSELSGGEQQRVSIARALMNGGAVILADEPTGALNQEHGKEVLEALRKLHLQGHTVVIVSHSPAIAAGAERRIGLRGGRIVSDSGRVSRRKPAPNFEPNHNERAIGLLGGLVEAIHSGFLALRQGLEPGMRLRTILPVTSVLLSVSLGILAWGTGNGIYEFGSERLNSMGFDTISIMPDSTGSGSFEGLSLTDAEIIEQVDNVRAVSPRYYRRGVMVRRSDVSVETNISAFVDLGAKERRGKSGYRIAQGDFITEDEDRELQQVALLGSVAREKLFQPADDPIGQQILIGNVPFRIKGVLKRRTNIGREEQSNYREIEDNANDWVFVPFKTASTVLFGTEKLKGILAFLHNSDRAAETVSEIRDAGVRLHGGDVYFFEYPQKLLRPFRVARQQLWLSGGALAGVALLAGNIGHLVIMQMSVRGRRREIGIRMAAGARPQDILRQFLSEALVVSFAGGLLGLVVALACAPLLVFFGLPVSLEWWMFAFPVMCAIVCGVPISVIPARGAAKLDPVTAIAQS